MWERDQSCTSDVSIDSVNLTGQHNHCTTFFFFSKLYIIFIVLSDFTVMVVSFWLTLKLMFIMF